MEKMKKEKEAKSIRKLATEKWRENCGRISISLAIFSLFVILSLGLAFLSPFTLIITLPFVIIPSFFALSGVFVIPEKENERESLSFFILYRNFYTPLFRGGYRVLIGLLKALLVFAVSLTVFTAIVYGVVLAKDQTFIDLINSIGTDISNQDLINQLVEYIESNELVSTLTNVSIIVSLNLSLLTFVHHLGVHSIKIYHNFLTNAPLPFSDLNYIYNITYSKIKHSIRKDYFKAFWFVQLALFIGAFGGSVLGWFLLNNVSPEQIFIFGTFIAFIFILFFIPYYLFASRLIYQKYATNFIETFIKESFKSIEEIKKTTKIDPEKEKEIKDFLENQVKVDNEENKEDKK